MDKVIIKKNRITIVMPVYNGAKYIRRAIDSLLGQTYKDFELLIINDGSTDTSADIVNSYKDPRIKLLTNPKNMGLVETRNRGVKEAGTEFVGFLDADDIAMSDRLEKQIYFLDAHSEVILLGGCAVHIDSDGNKTGTTWNEAVPSEEMPIELLFRNCFVQSTVLMRKDRIPEVLYRSGFAPAEDYDLWVRLARIGQVANLPDVLVKYRVHSTNTSSIKSADQERARREIMSEQLNKLGIFPSEEEYLTHRTNFASHNKETLVFLKKREVWLQKLLESNKTRKLFNQEIFSRVISKRFFDSCRTNTQAGWATWQLFWKSPVNINLSYRNKRIWLKICKFAVWSLLKK
jgi:glycosyltransferase involved in cell wall biosynthesis